MQNKINKIKELLKIQGNDGNWNYDPYMLGLYNGMEMALAIMEDREPVFRELTKENISKPKPGLPIKVQP